MASLIIADENEGRRNLLAGTLEREGFNVTRTSTLRQTEGTALGTMPDVLVLDAEWRSADALDSAQRLMADPEFSFKSRIVLLSRDTETCLFLLQKQITKFLATIEYESTNHPTKKHAKKEFVPPPADVAYHHPRVFRCEPFTSRPHMAMPMLQNMLNPEVINPQFVEDILAKLVEDEVEIEGVDSSNLGTLLKTVFGQLLESQIDDEEETLQIKHARKYGQKKSQKLEPH